MSYNMECRSCGRTGSEDDGIEPGGDCPMEDCDGTIRSLRHTHTFAPLVTVETDPDGSNPRIVDIDWADSYLNTLDADDAIICEYPDSCDTGEAACNFLDGLPLDDLYATLKEVAAAS